MKHHFGDFLDRSGGHWSFVPNAERHLYRLEDVSQADVSLKTLTLSASDKNWDAVARFSKLEELTLHEPSIEQLEFLPKLWWLKRLRITHARTKSIGSIARLQNLEELILEYVSGFDALSPLSELRTLRALHLENLRKVRDFSGLGGSASLQYLSIDGTFDWAQPIDNFDFLAHLNRLEFFRLGNIRCLAPWPALFGLTKLPSLKKVHIPTNLFPLEEYAFVEARLNGVPGACFQPFRRVALRHLDIPEYDIRFHFPNEELAERFPEVRVRYDGVRQVPDPDAEVFVFLGKRGGNVRCLSASAQTKCVAYETRYQDMVRKAQTENI